MTSAEAQRFRLATWLGVPLRIFRSFAGYLVLLLCAIEILKQPPLTFGLVDAVYLGTLCAVAYANARAARAAHDSDTAARKVLFGHFLVGGFAWLVCQAVQAIR